MTPSVVPVLVVVVALAGLGVLAAFRSGARGAYRGARSPEEILVVYASELW
ncbi:MAG: hypothetical protein WCF33_01145 [Pseudonocardiaceae bacterium]